MKLRDAPEWAEKEFEFPVSATEVVERAGDRTIEAPDRADSETIAEILTRSREATFQSRADLLDALRGNLNDEYIGRKYYDDRGSNPGESHRTPSIDTDDESF